MSSAPASERLGAVDFLKRRFRDEVKNSRHKQIFLDLFGGCGRLSRALRVLGWGSINFEIEDDERYNLEDSQVVSLIAGWVNSGCIAGVFLGTPCATWSRARRGLPGTPGGPLRSATFVMGLPGLPAIDQLKVRAGNRQLRVSCRILHEAIRAGVPCGIENPAGSWIWKSPPLAHLSSLPSARKDCFDMCSYGTPWRKRTRMSFWHVPHPLGGHSCSSKHGICQFSHKHHIVLQGKDPHGVMWTHRAQAYPNRLAKRLAQLLIQSADQVHLNRLFALGVGLRVPGHKLG